MMRLLFLFIAMCSIAQLPAQNLTWASPVTLSSTGVNSTDPRIVIDSNGNAVAAWVESGLIKASQQPVGGSWGTTVTLSNSGASNPRLGVDSSGNATAIWIESGVVKTAHLPFGGSWSAATTLSGSGVTQARLAVDGAGNTVAVWTRNNFIESSTKLFGGLLWSLASVLSAGSSNFPEVAIGADGTVVAVWHSIVSGSDIVVYSTSPIAGVWAPAQTMLAVTPSFKHHYPKVTVDGSGNATAVWFRYTTSGLAYEFVSVLTASLPKGASAWTAVPIALTQFTGIRNPADLSLSIVSDAAGNVFAAWTNSYDGFTFTNESAQKPISGSWIAEATPISPSIYSFQTDVSISSLSSALVTFSFFDGTNADILALETAISNPIYNTYGAIATVSTGADNAYPRVAYSSNGSTANAVAVWISNNGTNNLITTATGSKTEVAPPTNVAVTQSLNQFGVFQDYANTITWTASTNPNVQLYNLYRNGVFFAQVDSFTFSFTDHNDVQNGTVVYGVAAYTTDNFQSTVATVSFP